MIGLKRGTVKLNEYDPNWHRSFVQEAKKLKRVFGQDALNIQHVGSTAIRGILAKPIIDIGIIVPSLRIAKSYTKKLKDIGYELKPEDKKERLFFTKGPAEKRTHYLHLGKIGSGYVEDMISFRDYLLEHKDIAKQYSQLKTKLAEKYKDAREVYAQKKKKMIEQIIKRTGKV
ncbi:MAG: GrpB family protein [Candidatus Falkowbacteria bacterium]|nr:GrpB family protein [Candidatus Falkowbacteria bacterium]